MIISPDDSQVYEMKLATSKKEINYLHELIAYSSLDNVENKEWETTGMYLKTVDKFNDNITHCFVTPGSKIFFFTPRNEIPPHPRRNQRRLHQKLLQRSLRILRQGTIFNYHFRPCSILSSIKTQKFSPRDSI